MVNSKLVELQKAEVLLPKRPSVEKRCPYCCSKMKLVDDELGEYLCQYCNKYFTVGW